MAAARLAEVVARDPHPLVILRRSQHPFQELAVAGLQLVPLPVGAAGVLDPGREGVTDPLQLAQGEGLRRVGDGRDAGGDLETREGLGDEGRELRLQPSHLPAQLGAGEPLVAAHPERDSALSVQQMGHTGFECSSPQGPRSEESVKAPEQA